jgi:hypothetical protein
MDLCHGIVLRIRTVAVLDTGCRFGEWLSFWCLEKWTLVEAHNPCLGGYALSSAVPLQHLQQWAGITDWHSDECSPKHEF